MKRVLLLLSAVILLTGCGKSDEYNHPLFQKAKRAQSVGNGEEAAEFFKKFLDRRPHSIYVHLHLANVYDELLDQPLAAVYHYRKYLSLIPDATDAEEVKSWLKNCEKRCYEQLKKEFETAESATSLQTPPAESAAPEGEAKNVTSLPETPQSAPPEASVPPASTAPQAQAAAEKEIQDLKKLLEQYRLRHQLMQQELEKLRQPAATALPAPAPAPETSAADKKPAAAARTYRIQPGDTPGGIARKVYGKSSLYTFILRANPDLNERKLKPGMVIKIPPRPDSN